MSSTVPAGPAAEAARHVFTSEESARGRQRALERVARRREAAERARRRRREWMHNDKLLWAALQDAAQFGSAREEEAARRAWADHHRLLPEATGRVRA